MRRHLLLKLSFFLSICGLSSPLSACPKAMLGATQAIHSSTRPSPLDLKLASIENVQLPAPQNALRAMQEVQKQSENSTDLSDDPLSQFPDIFSSEMSIEEQVAVVHVLSAFAHTQNEAVSQVAILKLNEIESATAERKRLLERSGQDSFEADYLLLELDRTLWLRNPEAALAKKLAAEEAALTERLKSIDNINLPGPLRALNLLQNIQAKKIAEADVTGSSRNSRSDYDFSAIQDTLLRGMTLDEQVAVLEILGAYATETSGDLSQMAMSELQLIKEALHSWQVRLRRANQDSFQADYLVAALAESLGLQAPIESQETFYLGAFTSSPYLLPN